MNSKAGDGPIYVTRPHLPARDRLESYLDRAYSKRYLTNDGALVRELTSRLRDHLGVDHLVLVSSGTIALQVVYKLMNLDGQIVTTPFSFPATTSSIVWHGAEPVFADIESDSLNICSERVEEAICRETSGIVATHVYGNPCDTASLNAIAANAGIPVIYDAAQAFGVNADGESVLRQGSCSVLSFHATKLFHTLEGGAVIVKDADDFERARKIINFGFDGHGNILDVGINAKMNEFEAAMGLAVLDEIGQIETALAEISDQYDKELSADLARPAYRAGWSRNHSYYPVLFSDEEQLLRVQEELNQSDIYPRRYFMPSLDTVDAYGCRGHCEISRSTVKRVLCMPVYSTLESGDVSRICDIVNSRLD